MRSRVPLVVVAVVVTVVTDVAAGCAPAPPPDTTFTLLQANIGNTLLPCEGYVYKLCKVDVEDRIRDSIAALKPDVIALQEVLPDAFCDGFVDDDDTRVCGAGRSGPQIERIVPAGYSYACDPRNGYECVAIRDGAQVTSYDTAPPVESDADEECDDGFTVGSAHVFINRFVLNIVNAHPQSGFLGFCRAKQLRQVFGDLVTNERTIVTGDMNVDPFLENPDDPSAAVWNERVGNGKDFHYFSGPTEHEPPFFTTQNALFSGTLDHVAGNSGVGTCETLGVHEGTEFLDGDGVGCDHRALSCRITFPLPPVGID